MYDSLFELNALFLYQVTEGIWENQLSNENTK